MLPTVLGRIVEVPNLLDLNRLYGLPEFIVTSSRPHDLIVEVAMNRAFYRLGAGQNGFSPDQSRQQA